MLGGFGLGKTLRATIVNATSALFNTWTLIPEGMKAYFSFDKGGRGDITPEKELEYIGLGGCLFDGGDDEIWIDDHANLDGMAQWSFACWMKYDGNCDNGGMLVSKDHTIYEAQVDTANNRITLWISNTSMSSTTNSISKGDWYHVVCTYNSDSSGTGRIYINGGLNAEDTTYDGAVLGTNGSKVTIGGADDTSTSFGGLIKNAAMWNRELSQSDVLNIMTKEYSQLRGSELTGLLFWHSLDADTSLGDEVYTENNSLKKGISKGITAIGTTGITATSGSATAQTTVKGLSSGDQALLVASSGNQGRIYEDLNSIATTGKHYQVSIEAKHSGTGGDWILSLGVNSVANNKLLANLTSSDTTFQTYTAVVNDWTSNHRYLVVMENNSDDDGSVYVANFSIKEIKFVDSASNHDATFYDNVSVTQEKFGRDTPTAPRKKDNDDNVAADLLGNGSALFDGDDDFVELGSQSGDLRLSGSNGTVSAWILLPDVSDGDDYKRIVDKSDAGSGENGYTMWVHTDGIAEFQINAVAGSKVTSPTAITDGVWTHMAATWDGTTVKLYQNGILVDSATDSAQPPSDTTGMRIGSWNHSTAREFKGNIAQVGIWSTALTQAQINSIKEKTYDDLITSEKTNLVSWWGLDAEYLPTDLWDSSKSDANIWKQTGDADLNVAYSNGVFTITHTSSTTYADMYFTNAATSSNAIYNTLTSNLDANSTYKITFQAKINTGSAGVTGTQASASSTSISSTSYANYEFYYETDSSVGWTDEYFRIQSLSAGEVVSIKDFTVKKLQIEDLHGSNHGSVSGA